MLLVKRGESHGSPAVKGITHFVTGVTVASFFPAAVRAGMAGNPLYFILGGVCGLLSDTLDFKFIRFFAKRDIEVVPDPLAPDPAQIASAVAMAVNRAGQTGLPRHVRLNTIRLGSDRWQSYTVEFDHARHVVSVSLGAIVSTDGQPINGPAAVAEARPATATLEFPVRCLYQARIAVDIMDGPHLACVPGPRGTVTVEFMPWHRAWTHSLMIAGAAGIGLGLLIDPLAGLISGLAIVAHILGDQLGFMGSALFYPFRRARSEGLHMAHAADPFYNFGIIWVCLLLIFWNLGRQSFAALPLYLLPKLLVFGALLPMAAIWFLRRRHGRPLPPE